MAGRMFHHPAALVVAAVLLACLLALLAAPRQAEAAFPGENGPIVFDLFRGYDDPSSLYSRDPDTGAFARLTNNDGTLVRDEYPAVSPDGTRVAYLRSDFDEYPYDRGIYVAGADGSGARKIADVDGVVLPAWSPDGRRIAFASGPSGQREVYAVGADGSNRTKITDTVMDESRPAWSPDGTRIAFASRPAGATYGVYIMDADGSGAHRIADGVAPSWSPDGSKLAFSCGTEASICTADPDGSSQQKIVTDRSEGDPDIESVRDGSPAWSPDGTRIAFGRAINYELYQGNGIYTMNPDGSDLKLVAGDFSRALDPDWAPAPGGQSPAGQGGPPETTIISGPSGTTGPSAVFDFVSSRPGASFECSLDGAGFSPCGGPERYEALPGGGHAFEVRATDAAAGADPTPARLAWDVDARGPDGGVAVDGGRDRTRDRSVALGAADLDPGTGVSEVRLRNGGRVEGLAGVRPRRGVDAARRGGHQDRARPVPRRGGERLRGGAGLDRLPPLGAAAGPNQRSA